jgi:hypothetical protein
MSSYATGPVRDKNGARICSLAGIDAARNGIVTLRELDRGTELALQEVEAAKTKAQFYDKALMVARFTKATCDAFINLAATLSGNKGAEKVANAYGAASVGAGLAGNLGAGQQVNIGELVSDSVKAGSKYAGPNAGYLMKNAAVKGDLFRGAMNADKNGVVKSSIEYSADLATYTLEHLNATRAKAFVEIGQELFQYNDKISETFKDHIKDMDATSGAFESQRLTLKIAGANVRRRVRALEQFIASCEAELQVQQKQEVKLPPLSRRTGEGDSKPA